MQGSEIEWAVSSPVPGRSALNLLLKVLFRVYALRVEKSNFAALLCPAQELENAELVFSLLGMINPESLDLELAILLLRLGIDLGTAFCDRFGNLRDIIASLFYELEKEILDDLNLETTQILLSSPSLTSCVSPQV